MMKWYIIHGRRYGDDDDSTISFHAASPVDAIAEFIQLLGDPNVHEEGEGYVYISTVWDCGQNKPTEASRD